LPDHKIRRREQVLAAIKSSRIAIDDAPPKTLQGTRSKLRLLQRVYKIKLAVVDYFQLVVDDTDARTKRYEKLVELSCGLKKIAVDLDIPVIVLAQLNSNPQDENRAPRVTDVEECKKLYKDANVMLLLDRPYERNRYNGDWVERNPGQENVGFIDVAAIRSGAPGVIRANFYGAIHRWKTQGHGVAGNGSEETF
jgi:replicative DNA helicase